MKHIAIVEDEAAIRENYADVIRRQGYQVHTYQDRPGAQTAFEQRLPDLAIIDIGLGNEIDGGFALCQALRALSATVPIIFLTARDSDIDTVVGLRMGADDYLTKDVSLPHLMARIAALFRRSDLLAQTPSTEDKCLQSGPLYLDLDRMRVYWLDQLIDLTVTEFWMVHALVKRPGHLKTRQAIMDEAHEVEDDSTNTSHIKRIRKKFMVIDSQFDCIRTVYGMGYRWDEAQA